jgi:protease-4
VSALRAVGADAKSAAVVIFVDSGGGSALASDLIGHEVQLLAKKKPVVGVMGSVAASGGYYVLSHASRILAAPTTLTGSIGVLTGKLVVDGLFERWGLKSESLQRGRYALLHDATQPFADHERRLLERHNAEVYERFVRHVSEGRKLSATRVHELGRGRVWAGIDAEKNGLVDELGDLALGIERAREIAGLPVGSPVIDVQVPDELRLPSAAGIEAVVHAFAHERTWLLDLTTIHG